LNLLKITVETALISACRHTTSDNQAEQANKTQGCARFELVDEKDCEIAENITFEAFPDFYLQPG